MFKKKIAAGIFACSLMVGSMNASFFDSSSTERKIIQGIAAIGLILAGSDLALDGYSATRVFSSGQRTPYGNRVPYFLSASIAKFVGAGFLTWLSYKMGSSAVRS